ncbi:hypothetical protein HWB46_gp32 [Paenibacillus phage Tadhana]|uniref:Uncharacterized protein n=5 Tax=Fernvirus TaxID=2843380 RepID=A0A2I7SCZ7_9CAUD|nr:hypothetical protein FERN_31 [Paenibacillus phage Fern]YP_009593440.1 hypothetical protein FDG84_gp31 [Paenibacillus phage Willow]YP_009836294.1 hypothetical protein HWB43_gp37 [Paenibacillus phage BN12]YP_009836441.1 hypothetical protein HWB45_gp32 [Paenibacillus phage Pagassa]YP_009836511.1 hypothetical protein HWB46_gp32 [Paenibacillus phage Tadhana]ALA12336.1 hypothetical protein FERN_31 [Paenibacillus phage Fern]ALA12403.1 hypothetical protein WILLOW_31 [Paenibacillus phage Willow]AU
MAVRWGKGISRHNKMAKLLMYQPSSIVYFQNRHKGFLLIHLNLLYLFESICHLKYLVEQAFIRAYLV